MLAVEQLAAEALLAELLEEGFEILRPVEVAERLDEASPVEIGERRGIVRADVAIGDHSKPSGAGQPGAERPITRNSRPICSGRDQPVPRGEQLFARGRVRLGKRFGAGVDAEPDQPVALRDRPVDRDAGLGGGPARAIRSRHGR